MRLMLERIARVLRLVRRRLWLLCESNMLFWKFIDWNTGSVFGPVPSPICAFRLKPVAFSMPET